MEGQFTKENPGCYHQMLKYLSELSGIPITEAVQLPYNEVFGVSKKGNKIVKYPSYNINFVINGRLVGYLTKVMRKGNIPVLTNGKEDFPYDVNIDHFIVIRNRDIHSFGVSIIDHNKSYNDSLGGGWYQKVQLYEVNNKYFAMMDCSC